MAALSYAHSFRGLLAYRLARELAREILDVSKRFPKEENYALTDQVRRSSRAVGANIAEAWGKRSYEKHFLSKLTDADSEQLETQHWIETAVDCGYLSKNESAALLHKCQRIGQLLGGMMAKPAQFRRPNKVIKEDLPEYFTNHQPQS